MLGPWLVAFRIPGSYDTKIAKNLQHLDIMDILDIQNMTKSLFAQCSIDVKSAVTF